MKYAISPQEQQNLFVKISDWMSHHSPLLQANQAELADNPFCKSLSPHPLPYSGNSRLGFWYQHLCHQYFASHPSYQIVAEEIQLNHQGRTIGALDFVLRNTVTDIVEHWEVAIKFYLLFDGLWYGPNSHDRLDLKLSHMLSHQLAMSQHQCFQQQYPELGDIKPKLLMQGRLYINPFRDEVTPTSCLGYPIDPSQSYGYWCYADNFNNINEPLYILKKGQWLTGEEADSPVLKEVGQQFVHCQSQSGDFWFILPNEWPHHRS
ncbi:MAG TPA: DUF1853 domain-containing protein [Vibrio sp.]|uniref:DUF1853 family protein n=1 Tax=Vibrio sp. TaxID=678 RepID=UPI000EE69AE6|nr:DUF1853 family protein [Vibrio sp.]HCH01657.1 DUF1853 domain-containing protein [Vibrio sp.]